ncbi:hypothetical protein ELQ35_16640 [Peribacillus cavernae]|uniref:Uncharacterized protein n=1 Tax=Peribacillus cavernae TaxID=1674310 RepID=A0A3S0TYG3_9BACI|nr:hypothetical protein [Peribacillus cavernae]MDQ0219819.1 GTPase involved in cell partitioning and DNA repair [Peribacillus cavernae]RUQ27210.1 hypothetical protein ELQ35_16640 [Peribacillus cavernae]
MGLSTNLVSLSLGLSVLLFTGCSNEEISKDTEQAAKQVEQKAEEATGQVKEEVKQLSDTAKKETPVIVQNMKDIYKEGDQKIKENTLQKGDKATVKKDAYLALNPEAYDELYQLIEVNDLKGVEKIEKEKQVSAINKDSEVEVIERDVRRTRVKMTDSGKEGYLPTTLLEPAK